jgi:hypothetical protein
MSKKGKSASEARKVTFGVRRKGKHSKTLGPKDSKPSKYRGQGR